MRGIVNVGTVFDGIHAGLGRPQNALRSVRMGCDLASQAMRVGHDGLHLLQRVLRGLGIVAVRKHAAGGANLDQVGAVLDGLADLVLHAFDAVGHAVGGDVIFEGQQVVVAVPAGDAERRAAHQHARAGNIAGVDGIAQGDVAVALGTDVAHGGEAGLESETRIARANQG